MAERLLGINDGAVVKLEESRILYDPSGDSFAQEMLGRLYSREDGLPDYIFGKKHGLPINDYHTYSVAVGAGYGLVADSPLMENPLDQGEIDALHKDMNGGVIVSSVDQAGNLAIKASRFGNELEAISELALIWFSEYIDSESLDPHVKADVIIGFSAAVIPAIRRARALNINVFPAGEIGGVSSQIDRKTDI
ncbi:MAG TPA: hypothetical protein VG917_00765 [Patescibacteria group bacterium]|nr:hypothetical protein [Patescibacteria group bacterium]